ncbi:MAG: hypothetical protein NTW28_22485, partial [Candidatus Solibacter sp.]|nr:hypothetical protein [Candidatus Solibacter sp.]
MVVRADRSDIGDFRWAVFGEWSDVVELDAVLVVDWVVVHKTVQDSVTTLLGQHLLLLGISYLTLYNGHTV